MFFIIYTAGVDDVSAQRGGHKSPDIEERSDGGAGEEQARLPTAKHLLRQ